MAVVREIKSIDEWNEQILLVDAENMSGGGYKSVVVDFWAPWCGPCKAVSPKYEELASQYPSIKFWKVDIDELSEIAEKFDVTSIPTFVILQNKRILKTVVGADLKSLTDTLDRIK